MNVVIGFAEQAVAQNISQDQRLLQANAMKDGQPKVERFNEIAYYYLDKDAAIARQMGHKALLLSRQLKWDEGIINSLVITGRTYWRIGDFDSALIYHKEALQIAESIDNDSLAIISIECIGQDFADAGKYAQALTHFEKGLQLSTRNNLMEKAGSFHLLNAWVYAQQGNYAAATQSNYDALKVYESLDDMYGIAVAFSNLADNYSQLENYELTVTYLKKSIKPLMVTGDKQNLCSVYNSISNIFLREVKLSEATLYADSALVIAKEINKPASLADALTQMGRIDMANANYDGAIIHFEEALKLYRSVSGKQNQAVVYNNLGICYVKTGALDKAQSALDSSVFITNLLDSKVTKLDYYASQQLLDSATGNWMGAYINYRQYISNRDSIYNLKNSQKMLQSQMQYESEKKEIAAEAELKKQRLIRNCIGAGLGGVLIFLVVVFRQRNKISREKKRSDNLLLNILPEETADELKTKGTAEAKHFDEVTVMFTDFKGFTQISEKLSPAELVNEIHACFKVFDEIISKHHIEKIKTIGDSYMCAGGLPVTNSTHPFDVVQSALEILEFINIHQRQRKKENKEIFEIRIGIHTGPVVAGIVGVKKFAYDIWGDTVNIASRMETSGEVGKVNISGATYEIVKDKYMCAYRGKIPAKNKGEIDMYFVLNEK